MAIELISNDNVAIIMNIFILSNSFPHPIDAPNKIYRFALLDEKGV